MKGIICADCAVPITALNRSEYDVRSFYTASDFKIEKYCTECVAALRRSWHVAELTYVDFQEGTIYEAC
jgi:hypothetical protein